MAQLNFPSNPSIGDIYVQDSTANVTAGYDLDGNLASSLSSFTSISGDTGVTYLGTGFSSDGTSMYAFSPSDDTFYQFTLSTPWDETTAIYANKSFTPTAGNNWDVHLIRFDPTGTKMYAGGAGQTRNTLYEYTLSTPWDISTANPTATDSLPTLNVAGVTGEVENIIISPNGSYVYALDYQTGTLHRWTLNTAWDLSSRTSNSPDQTTTALYSWSTFSWGLDISDDGTKLYVTNGNPVGLGEWTLSPAYSISGLSTSPNTSSAWSGAAYKNFVIGKQGLKLYATGAGGVAHQDMGNSSTVDLSTPDSRKYTFTGSKWKLFSKKYSYKGSAPSNVSNATQIDLSAGSFFNLSLSQQTTVSFTNPPSSGFAKKFQVKLSILSDYANISSYDLENASYDNVSFSVAAQDILPRAVFFKPDGTKMYVVGRGTDKIFQYTLSSGFDLSTASYDNISFSVISQDGNPVDIHFNLDGTKMYILGFDNDRVYQYTLSTGFDLSTASYDNISFSVISQEASVSAGLSFNTDGTKMYIVGQVTNTIFQYTLSSGFDLSTASYDGISLDITSIDTDPLNAVFNGAGTKMYVLGLTNKSILQYTLSTGFDLSTASYDSVSFSVAAQEASPTGIFFSPNGAKLYVIGQDNDTVYQYTTGSSGNTTPTVSWPNSITWETGSAPTLPELGQTDVLEFFTSDGGTTYYGKLKEDNVS